MPESSAGDLPEPGLHRSYWLRDALGAEGDPAPLAPLEGESRHDVAIIGGGYTGLWTAYFLTERDPGTRVVILEQDICGGGPSGRNGGFLHGWWDQLPLLTELHGREGALELAWAADEAVEGTRRFCERHDVDAWFTRGGYLRVSASGAQDDDWAASVAACRELGVEDQYVALGPDEVQRRCASPAFRGGAFMANAATVQPARLARGLRRVLLERGVAIHEGTRARRLRASAGVRIGTDAGEVHAEQAVLAMNAWAAGWPGFRSSLVAWGSYILLTEPAPERLRDLGWTEGEAITDSRFTVHYFRTTPDGRVAFGAGVGSAGFGGRIGPLFERDRRAVQRARAGLDRLLPSFADVPASEAWGGPIDVSSDRLPVIGAINGGRVHFAHGYSGNGVGPAHLAGRILAARLCGSTDTMAGLPNVDRRTRRFPPEPFRYIGARIVREALIRQDELADDGRRAGPLVRELSRLPRRLGYRLGPDRRRRPTELQRLRDTSGD
ncbi:MAG: FAD-binding oxidoreductase [Chloroflexota bacterium]|nr:FAD-binding oxidoreductase [Chloroflexota bacterium]